MVRLKIGQFLTTFSIENFLEYDSAILKILYLKIVLRVCAPIKKNRKQIAENLDVDLVKSDRIIHIIISPSRL